MSGKAAIAALLFYSVLLVAFFVALATNRGPEPPVRLLCGTVGAAGMIGVLIYLWARRN